MFGPIGGPEMVVILIIALLVFGPRRLPDLARSVGKGLSELRRASMDMRRTLEREIHLEDKDKDAAPASPEAVGPASEDPEQAVASSLAGPAGPGRDRVTPSPPASDAGSGRPGAASRAGGPDSPGEPTPDRDGSDGPAGS